jgi:hypothetical protein
LAGFFRASALHHLLTGTNKVLKKKRYNVYLDDQSIVAAGQFLLKTNN